MEKYVAKIQRNLNAESSRQLKSELLEVLDRGTKQVELDFSETEAIDSSGLGKLLLFNEKFREAGGNFRITNVHHGYVKELFQLINLDNLIQIEFRK